MADFDIVTLVLSQHEAFRRAFAQVEQLSEPEELGRRWRALSDELEVHAAGEETVLYPELLRDVADSAGETRHAVKDHNEIREAALAVDAHEVGTEPWWQAFRAAREVTADHLDEEEHDILPPFQAQVSAAHREELGLRWLQFLEEHEGAKGLSGESVDPVEYVQEHTGTR